MNYENRKELYEKIAEIRKRPLISYVTSFRSNANASIASDVISHFLKQLSEIPAETENIDLLLISYGGDPTVAYRIVNLLRERFKKFGVLLPYTAYSAATLISLGADEIIMHPFANLGPVDPQLTHKSQDKEIHFGSEDLRNFLDFVKTDVGISDQEQLQKSFELACKEVGAILMELQKEVHNWRCQWEKNSFHYICQIPIKLKRLQKHLISHFTIMAILLGQQKQKK